MRSRRELSTPRLRLRSVKATDGDLLQRMDADPLAMANLGGIRDADESHRYAQAQADHWEAHGFGWWLAFLRETDEFVGRGGIRHLQVDDQLEVEVGYALRPDFWGRGLATELATTAVEVGLQDLRLPKLVGVVLPTNVRSKRVLTKVGFNPGRTTIHKGSRVEVWIRQREPDVP